MATNVGEVYAVLGLDKSSFDSSLAAADSRFDSFGSSLASKAGAIAKTVGAALVVGTAAFAGIATVGVRTFADVEAAAASAASKMDLAAIAKSSGTTLEGAFDGVRDHVMSLSDELGQLNTNAFDPKSIAQACANLASGGFDVATASAKDLSPMLALATATNYDLGSSCDSVTNAMSVYGKNVSDLGTISDEYTTACSASKMEMKDLDYAMKTAGPSAAAYGVSLETTVANLETFSQKGIKGEMAGTALRDVFNTLGAPVDSTAKALGEMGFSVADVDTKTHDVTETLGKMYDASMKSGRGASAFTDVFGASGGLIFTLAKATAETNAFKEGLVNSNGAAETTAKFMLNTFWGSFDAASGAVSSLAMLVGSKLEPAFKGVLDWFSASGAPAIRSFIEAIANGDWDSVGDMIAKGFDFATDKLSDVGKTLWSKIQPGIQYLEGKFGPAIKKALTLTGEVAGAALVVKGILAIAPVAASVGIAVAQMAAKSLVQFGLMTEGALATKLAFISTWAAALGPIAAVVAGAGLVVAGIGAIGYSLNPSKFTEFGFAAKGAFNIAKDAVTDCWAALQKGDFEGVKTAFVNAFIGAGELVKEIDWAELGTECVTMVGDGARAIINKVVDLGTWIYDNLKGWVDNGGPRQLGNDIANAIGNEAKNIIGSNFDLWGAIKGTFGTLGDWAMLALDIAVGIGQGLYDHIAPYVAKVHNYFVKAGGDLVYAFTDTGLRMGNAIVSGINSCLTEINTIIKSITDKVGAAYAYVTSFGQSGGEAQNGQVTTEGSGDHTTYHVIRNGMSSSTTDKAQADGWAAEEKTRLEGSSTASVSSVSKWGTSSKSSTSNAIADMKLHPNTLVGGLNIGGIQILPQYDQETALGISSGTDKNGNSVMTEKTGGTTITTDKKTGDKTWSNNKGEVTYTAKDGDLNVSGVSLGEKVESVKATVKPLTDAVGTLTQGVVLTDAQIKATAEAQKQIFISGVGLWDETIKDDTKKETDATNKNIATTSTGVNSMMGNIHSNMREVTLNFKQGVDSATANNVNQSKLGSDYFSEQLRNGSNGASNSLILGGGAVQIGLNSSGQKMAVIGSVAQAQFAAAGGKWTNDTANSGNKFFDSSVNSGKTIEGSAGFFGNAIEGATTRSMSSLESAFSKAGLIIEGASSKLAGNNAANAGSSSKSSRLSDGSIGLGANPKVSDNIAPDDSGWTAEGFEEITNSSMANLSKTIKTGSNDVKSASAATVKDTKTSNANTALTFKQIDNNAVATSKTTTAQTTASAGFFDNKVEKAAATTTATTNANNATSIATTKTNDAVWKNAGIVWKNVNDNASATAKQSGADLVKHVTDTDSGLCAAGDNVEESLTTGAKNVKDSVDGAVTSMNECSMNIGVTASNILGLANRGGGAAWGGTGVGGGGAWIGTGSTAVNGRGYVDWGGTATSIAASNSRSGSNGSFSWRARGGLFDNGPELIGIGEHGTEAVLPADITKTLMMLTQMGLSRLENDNNARVNLPFNQMENILGNSNRAIKPQELNNKMAITLIIEMNGKQMAKEIMPFAFGETKRAGLRTKH